MKKLSLAAASALIVVLTLFTGTVPSWADDVKREQDLYNGFGGGSSQGSYESKVEQNQSPLIAALNPGKSLTFSEGLNLIRAALELRGFFPTANLDASSSVGAAIWAGSERGISIAKTPLGLALMATPIEKDKLQSGDIAWSGSDIYTVISEDQALKSTRSGNFLSASVDDLLARGYTLARI